MLSYQEGTADAADGWIFEMDLPHFRDLYN